MIKMALTIQKASDILGLPKGADLNSICTRYKQMAVKWHPEKHKQSLESRKKFQQVTLAYKRLTDPDVQHELDMNECFALFQQIVFKRAASNGVKQEDSDSSDNSDEDSYSEDSEEEEPNRPLKNNTSTENNNTHTNSNSTEEEKERKKAEKRRLKKKRQRERKRLEKGQKLQNGGSKQKQNDKGSASSQDPNIVINRGSSSEEDSSFDPTSAFFTKVVSKKKRNTVVDLQPNNKKDKSDKRSEDEAEENIDPKVLRSRQLAIRGNEMAQVDQYTAAIQLFTEAISLDPSDFRFFGNRSYCFDRIKQYEKALRDAEKAIKLYSDWPKGYFRKGRALAGLKIFGDAETAFMQVLKLDKECDDAVTELLRVRTHQLMDMGFSKGQSEEAIKMHDSVQAALESLLAGVGETVCDLYITDDEDEGFRVQRSAPIPPPTSNPSDVKMDPTNPEGLTALWVGNVLPSVTEKRLNQLFSKFGQVTSVRPLPDKYCAFVNFKTKESAGRAMHQLQGTEIDGQKLLIKFPDNPLTTGGSGGGGGSVTIRKPVASNTTTVKPVAAAAAAVGGGAAGGGGGVRNTPKQTGPVNGDECYFWRTTGCTFGSDCKWQHYPKSKGTDRKPWQK